jgi:hypothetical protein
LTFTENVGDVEVRVAIRTQVCSATDCLPPHTSRLELPLLYRTNVDSDR